MVAWVFAERMLRVVTTMSKVAVMLRLCVLSSTHLQIFLEAMSLTCIRSLLWAVLTTLLSCGGLRRLSILLVAPLVARLPQVLLLLLLLLLQMTTPSPWRTCLATHLSPFQLAAQMLPFFSPAPFVVGRAFQRCSTPSAPWLSLLTWARTKMSLACLLHLFLLLLRP